jgi:hypothetical protein
MVALPTPADLVSRSKIGDCLGINPPVFEIGNPGFHPVIMGAIGAALGPISLILDLDLKSPKLPKKIIDLIANLPSVILDGFNLQAKGMPAISISIGGITAKLGDITIDPKLFNIGALKDFVLSILLSLFDIFLGILKKLPQLPSIDLKAALKINPLIEGFDAKFVSCLIKPLEAAFSFLP